MSGLYANLPRMSDAKFAALLADLVEAARDNFDDPSDAGLVRSSYMAGAWEAVGHQVAVFLAQRYNESVGTAEAMELLEVDQDRTYRERLKLARNAMAAIAKEGGK